MTDLPPPRIPTTPYAPGAAPAGPGSDPLAEARQKLLQKLTSTLGGGDPALQAALAARLQAKLGVTPGPTNGGTTRDNPPRPEPVILALEKSPDAPPARRAPVASLLERGAPAPQREAISQRAPLCAAGAAHPSGDPLERGAPAPHRESLPPPPPLLLRPFSPKKLSRRERLVAALRRTPAWGISLAVHGLTLLIMALMWVAEPYIPEIPFTVSLGTGDSAKPRLNDSKNKGVAPQKSAEQCLDEIPIPLDTPIVLDHNETQNEKDAISINLDDSVAAGVVAFGQRCGGGRLTAVARGGGSLGSERAVERGLDWLARHQDADGAWAQYWTHCNPDAPCSAAAVYGEGYETGITGLATLAFLAAGYTGDKGRYADTVNRALEWLVKRQSNSGSFSGAFPEASYYHLYEQAIVTMALAEAYGMTNKPAYGKAAQKGVEYLCSKQNRALGMDTSVMGFVAMAITSARLAKCDVPGDGFRWAREWFVSMTGPDGSLGYNGPGGGEAGGSLTAVGCYGKVLMGVPQNDPLLVKGIAAITRNKPSRRDQNLYHWYYTTLAAFHTGGTLWNAWNAKMREIVISCQSTAGCESGSWRHANGHFEQNVPYATALGVLILEVYYRYLPLYGAEKTTGSPVDGLPKTSMIYGAVLHGQAMETLRGVMQARGKSEVEKKAACDKAERALRSLLDWSRGSIKMDDREDEKQLPKWREEAMLALAQIYLERNQIEDSLTLLAEFARSFPKSERKTEALRLQGAAALKQAARLQACAASKDAINAQRQVALDALQELLKLHPGEPCTTHLLVADLHLALGQPWKALPVFEGIVSMFSAKPEDAASVEEARGRICYCLVKLEKYTEAADAIGRVKKPPISLGDLVDLWLGKADRDLKDRMTAGKALVTCEEVMAFIDGHPDLPDRDEKRWAARRRMVRAHAELEHWGEAMKLCEALRKERPDSLDVEEDLATCYIEAGRFEDAQRHLAGLLGRTVEGSPLWWRVKFAALTCSYRAGQYEETASAIRALAMLYPSMGGPALKPEFEKLRKACEGKMPK